MRGWGTHRLGGGVSGCTLKEVYEHVTNRGNRDDRAKACELRGPRLQIVQSDEQVARHIPRQDLWDAMGDESLPLQIALISCSKGMVTVRHWVSGLTRWTTSKATA